MLHVPSLSEQSPSFVDHVSQGDHSLTARNLTWHLGKENALERATSHELQAIMLEDVDGVAFWTRVRAMIRRIRTAGDGEPGASEYNRFQIPQREVADA